MRIPTYISYTHGELPSSIKSTFLLSALHPYKVHFARVATSCDEP